MERSRHVSAEKAACSGHDDQRRCLWSRRRRRGANADRGWRGGVDAIGQRSEETGHANQVFGGDWRRTPAGDGAVEPVDHFGQTRIGRTRSQPARHTRQRPRHELRSFHDRIQDLLQRLGPWIRRADDDRSDEIARKRAPRPDQRDGRSDGPRTEADRQSADNVADPQNRVETRVLRARPFARPPRLADRIVPAPRPACRADAEGRREADPSPRAGRAAPRMRPPAETRSGCRPVRSRRGAGRRAGAIRTLDRAAADGRRRRVAPARAPATRERARHARSARTASPHTREPRRRVRPTPPRRAQPVACRRGRRPGVLPRGGDLRT